VVEKADQLDKEEVLNDHEGGSEKGVYRNRPSSEALCLKSSLEEVSYL
jgi:hypothetical protein